MYTFLFAGYRHCCHTENNTNQRGSHQLNATSQLVKKIQNQRLGCLNRIVEIPTVPIQEERNIAYAAHLYTQSSE